MREQHNLEFLGFFLSAPVHMQTHTNININSIDKYSFTHMSP